VEARNFKFGMHIDCLGQ